MDLNLVLFPAPKSSYSIGKSCGELLWIPKKLNDETPREMLPPCEVLGYRASCPVSFLNSRSGLKVRSFHKSSGYVLQPQHKWTESDEDSLISTIPSKKQASEEKIEYDNKSSFKTHSNHEEIDEHGEISEEKFLPSKPYHTDFYVKRNSVQEERIFYTSDIFCKEENPVLPTDEDPRRIPKISSIQDNFMKYNFTEMDERILTSDRMTANKPICYDQPLRHQRHASLNANQKIQIFSSDNTKSPKQENNTSLNPLSRKDGNQISAQPKLVTDRSQSSFEPVCTDENIEGRESVYSPRSLSGYCTKTKLAPKMKLTKLLLSEVNEKPEIGETDFFSGRMHEHLAPSSARLRLDKYQSGYNLNKSSSLSATLLSPKAFERATFHRATKEQKGSKQLNHSLNESILKDRESVLSISNDADHIPCMLLRSKACSSKVLVYFHGNGEDINLAKDLLKHLRDVLKVNVLAVEYPGYGLYKGSASESRILEDSECVYEFIVTSLKVHPRDIIVLGRSIGSGPATHLASKHKVGVLILMAPFTSIKAVVKDFMGSWAQRLIKERFNNLEAIKKVACPTFIVHGQKDKVVPFQHSKKLHDACHALTELVLPVKMSHVEFDFSADFTDPLTQFLKRCNIDLEPKGISGKVYFPKKFFDTPDYLKVRGSVRTVKV